MDGFLSQLTEEARGKYLALLADKERLEKENVTLKGKQARAAEVSKRLSFTPEDETPLQGITDVPEHESDQEEI